eukprot:Gb_05538 [translate_table: standard]
MWLALNNKVLTWDNMKKRNKSGCGRCSLCKVSDETITHLLITYPYTSHLWKVLEHELGFTSGWSGSAFEECLRKWNGNAGVKRFKALLVNVA